MARPRKGGNKDLPPNLYQSKDNRTGEIYYRYRDPRSGKFHGLGIDKAQAITDALGLNAAIYTAISKAKIERIKQPPSPLFRGYTKRYRELCKKRGLKPNTLKTRFNIVNMLDDRIGNTPIGDLAVSDIAEIIEGYIDQGKDRMAQTVRSIAIDIFKDAAHDGLVKENPAMATRNPRASVKRARLTLDEFKAILQQAETSEPWVANSMRMALITGQRREDIANMKFKDITKTANGDRLKIQQGKTGTKLLLDTSLRLDAVGLSIAEVVKQCRDNVISSYLVHHTRNRNNAKPGDKVWKDTITRHFQQARDKTGIQWEGTPPSFHEVRSLAARLWSKQQGKEFAQALLGHKDERMTATYRDDRGAEWQEVSV